MTEEPDNPDQYVKVDQVLQAWRQGDCVLGEHWFVHRIHPSVALTEAARTAAEAGVDLAESLVAGLVVVTQTCDIVRTCRTRSYVEVCPLVEVDHGRLHEIKCGHRPAFAFLPRLADHKLVADLDRVMTVEKPVVATWERTPGWTSDDEVRRFQQALARKRARFAFPDDFTSFVAALEERLTDKHGKNSDEGRGLRALREIRIQASPSWDADVISLMFWFIRHDHDAEFEGKSWADLSAKWLALIPISGRFIEVQCQVSTLDDLTAAEYVNSDPLALEHLSSRAGK